MSHEPAAGGNTPAHALVEYRDDLVRRMNRLPFTHADRGRLADVIRQVEAAIDRISE